MHYCGTDIIEVDRIKQAIQNTEGFKEKVYTKNEINEAQNKGEKTLYEYFAGRFAAKEAIYKALSKIKEDLNLFEIEVGNDKSNKDRPYVVIHDHDINKLMGTGKVKIDVSISHIKEYATATAIIEYNND